MGSHRYFTLPYDRRVDIRPRCDVGRSDAVGGPSEAARHASELVPRWAVLWVHRPARRTGAGGVPRVHEEHRDTRKSGLVFHEGSQLAKGPRAVSSPLGTPNRGPLADSPEVFEGYRPLRAFGPHDEALGNAMVDVTEEARLPVAHLLEVPFRTLRPLPLEGAPEVANTLSHPVHGLGGIDHTVRIRGEVLDAEVHTQDLCGTVGSRVRGRYHDREKPPAVTRKQVTLSTPDSRSENPPLELAHAASGSDTTPQREQGDLVHSLPREDARIVGNGPLRAEVWATVGLGSSCIRHLGDHTDSHLGRESETLADLPIGQVMQSEPFQDLLVKGDTSKPLTRLIEPNHGTAQGLCLTKGKVETGVYSAMHKPYTPYALFKVAWKLNTRHPRSGKSPTISSGARSTVGIYRRPSKSRYGRPFMRWPKREDGK